MTKSPQAEFSDADAVAAAAASNTLAMNPLVSLRSEDFFEAARTVFRATIRQPGIAAEQWWSFIGELGK